MNPTRDFLWADWPAPAHIRAGMTLRSGGVSALPYNQLNMGVHTGDRAEAVRHNRRALRAALSLPGEPAWLAQVHGRGVVCADEPSGRPADAAVGCRPGSVCAVLTADCLPVVFCDQSGRCWAAAHAGWRGLAAGVLEATVDRLPAEPEHIIAWLGPAIGAHNFEVGAEVRAALIANDPGAAAMFTPAATPDKYFADIRALARNRLKKAGVHRLYGDPICTFDNAGRFYSYRRESPTGRMATLIWSL